MSKLKAKILEWLAGDDTEILVGKQLGAPLAPTAVFAPIDTWSLKDNAHYTAQGTEDDTPTDDLPVHEATKGQIEAWHAWRDFYTLRNFLYQHDLIWYHKIFSYDVFKVGLDRGRQRATFSVDDTHYLAFDFDETTGQAKDYAEACRVLAKINLLRNLRGLSN